MRPTNVRQVVMSCCRQTDYTYNTIFLLSPSRTIISFSLVSSHTIMRFASNMTRNNVETEPLLSKRSLRLEQSASATTTPTSSSPSVKSLVIDRNLTLWSTNGRNISQFKRLAGTSLKDKSEESQDDDRKKLLILFAYMLPKEKHLEKYRRMYFQHGFDVLTVKTSPFQFFFPTIGAQKVASNVVSFVSKTQQLRSYPYVVVHAFSVGGYQFAEFIQELQKLSKETKDALVRSIQETIFDSPCDVNSVPYGLSRTIAGDNIVGRLLEVLFNTTKYVFYPLSTKYHKLGSDTFFNHPLPCPSFFFASKTDKMANVSIIQSVIDIWKQKGVDVGLKTWENTRHVGHYHAHPKEYEKDVESFLKKINMA